MFIKLTIKTPERSHWCRSGVFIVNFVTYSFFSGVSTVNFQNVDAVWDKWECSYFTSMKKIWTIYLRLQKGKVSLLIAWNLSSKRNQRLSCVMPVKIYRDTCFIEKSLFVRGFYYYCFLIFVNTRKGKDKWETLPHINQSD